MKAKKLIATGLVASMRLLDVAQAEIAVNPQKIQIKDQYIF